MTSDMKNELISIIVPVYNCEKYLEQCIDSILNQTYKNLEIILVNDGSTDLSGEICDKYAQKDCRIRVFHQKNSGAQAARSFGIENASGVYIGFVDSDDWIEDDMYECLYKCIGESDLVTSGMWYHNRNGVNKKVVDTFKPGKYKIDSEYFCDNLIVFPKYNEYGQIGGVLNNLWSKLFKASVVKECYLAANIKITDGEDLLFTLIYILHCNEIIITNECYYHYRYNEVSVSNSTNMNYLAEMNRFYETLSNAMSGHAMEKTLKEQLDKLLMYFIYSYTSKKMGISLDIGYPRYIFPQTNMLYRKNIVLFGAGMVGKSYYNDWKYNHNIDIIMWIDNAVLYDEIYGKKILKPENILDCDYDYVVCAVLDSACAEKMKVQLMNCNVKEDKILWEHPIDVFWNYFLKREI